MKYVMFPTGERTSLRFELLCERLEHDNTLEEINTVLAHVVIFWLKWATDPATDTGLFWGVSEKRLGLWSEWPKPLAFGRALAGTYCKAMTDVYPAELLAGREGFVLPGVLDVSWETHKRRPNAADLVVFLTDPVRRARQAANYRISATLPAGWIDDDPPEGNRKDTVAPSAECSSPPPPPDVVRKRIDINQRNVTEGKKRTGYAKTDAMRETIIANKYSNPLVALETMDDTTNAIGYWVWGVENKLSEVQTLLAEMTETHDAWAKIGNPAAVAMSRIRKWKRASQ